MKYFIFIPYLGAFNYLIIEFYSITDAVESEYSQKLTENRYFSLNENKNTIISFKCDQNHPLNHLCETLTRPLISF
ncbi:hypothetical protein BpHYR1_046029 [Brachionus plicatilis]|uniref:Uncharacterized protein n=1 Tax=Brachionus plicatilis TaxID=10195 RepID=A0A3M7SCV2_BRAPC|nr:hypothetical protein BpHYR1_046029 [Brachionus plicatilis]